MNLDPLRFAIEIQGNASQDLDGIISKLEKLKNESVTIKVDGGQIDALLKRLQGEDGKLTFHLPDLSKLLSQIQTAHGEMKSITDLGKQWNEIPAMENALKHARELVGVMEKLRGVEEKNLPNNTGTGSDFQKKLQELSTSLSAMYKELPNVASQSLRQFMQQLEGEMRKVNEVIGNIGANKFARGASDQIAQLTNKLDALMKFGENDGVMGKIKSHIAQVEQSILASIGNVITAITGMKAAIQNDNFTAFAKRVERCVEAIEKLNDAFGKFSLTIGKDEGMRHFMTGLGEVIANVRTTMNQVNAGSGGGSITTSMQSFDKSVQDALTHAERLQAVIIKFEQLSRNYERMGFDHKAIDIAIEKAKEYKTIMEAVVAGGGEHLGKTASMWAMEADFRTIMAKGMQSIGASSSGRDTNKAESEIERLTEKIRVLKEVEQEAMSKGVDTTKLRAAIEEMEKLRNGFKAVASAGLSPTLVKETKDYTATLIEANKQRMIAQQQMRENKAWQNEAKKAQQDEQSSVDAAKKKWAEITVAIEKYQNTITAAQGLGLDVSNLELARNFLVAINNQLQEIINNGGRTNAGLLFKNVINGEYGASKILGDAERAKLEKQIRSAGSSTDFVKQANDEITKLTRLLTNLRSAEANAGKFNVDHTALSDYIQRLDRIRDTLFAIRDAGGVLNGQTARDITGQASFIKDAEAAKAEAAQVKANTAIAKENASAKAALSLEERKLAQAMGAATQQANHQSQVLSDLKGMMMQYLSVYGAQQFVQEMANITGELELQQKSLEVILSSASMAQELYGEIRDLSQQSPYTFQDLLKSTRQLAAFGIESKDLYGTMKALSDIGAGLSVDVQRLILAYGHVRSYGYLSGIQNRQFETAGIDLIGGLADHYNKLADAEIKAGRAAEHVTRKDVFKMMRNKEIGFEDVNSVIMGLDEPGGRFYNMQERQFETLGGKLRNLRNNYNIMMSEMGQSNKGVLMGGVNLLNELTENWSKYATIIGAVLVPLGTMRLAQYMVNGAIGMQTNAMTRNIVAMARSEAAMKSMNAAMAKSAVTARSWKNLWGASRIFSPFTNFFGGLSGKTGGAGNISGSAMRQVAAKGLREGTLTKSNLLMMGVSKDLTHAQRYMMLSLAGVNREQAKAMASSTGLSRVWYKLTFSARAAGIAVRSFVASLGTMFLQMAPIVAITMAIERVMAVSRDAEETARQWRENAKNDVKEIDDTYRKFGGDRANGYGRELDTAYSNDGFVARRFRVTFDPHSLDSNEVKNALDEMRVKLQSYSPLYNGDLVDIYKMEDQYDQLAAMMKKMEDLRFANDVNEMVGGQMEDVVKRSAGSNWFTRIFNDTVTTNMKDFENTLLSEYRNLERSVDEAALEKIKAFFPNVENIADVKAVFRAYVSGVDDVTRKINDSQALREVFNVNASAMGVRNELNKVAQDMKTATEHAASILNQMFKSGDTGGAVTYLEKYISNLETAASIASPEARDMLTKVFLDQIKPLLDQNGLGGITEEVQRKLVNEKFMELINGRLTEDTTPEERRQILDEVSRQTIEWGKSYGIDMAGIGKNSAEAFNDAMSAALKFVRPLNQWQKEIRNEHIGEKGKTVFSDFYNAFRKDILDQPDLITFFAEDMKKKHDELAKEIENGFPLLRHVWNIDIEPDFKIKTANLDKLKKIRDAVKAKLDSIMAGGPWTTEDQNRAKEQLQNWLSKADMQIVLEETAKEYGYSYGDDKNKGKGKGSGGSKTYRDEFAKRWDERIRIMKEAYDWYDKWEKRVGDTTAINKVNEKYREIFDEWRTDKVLPFNFDSNDVKNYVRYIEQIRDDALGRYRSQKNDKGKNNGQEALRVYRQAASLLAEIDSDNFDRKADEFASSVKRALDDMTRIWGIYSSVRSNTGNEALANTFAGGGFVSGETQADRMEDRLMELAGTGIDFSKVLGMSEDEMQTYLEGLDIAQENIKGVLEGLKDWQKVKLDQKKKDIEEYSKVLGSLVDYQTLTQKAEDKYAQSLESSQRLLDDGVISQAQKNEYDRLAEIERDNELMKLSTGYVLMTNNALSMTKKELNDAADAAERMLKRLLEAGKIKPEDYAKQMADLDKKRYAWDANAFFGKNNMLTAFLQGGTPGLDKFIEATISEAETNGDSETVKTYTDYQKHLEKVKNTLGDFGVAIALTTGVLDGLGKAAQSLAQMFDALGNKGMADFFSDMNDIIGGVSSILSPANNLVQNALSGNVSGLVSSAISAPVEMVTSPITAFARLSDKRRERRIEALRDDLRDIENTLDIIRKLRERELGYDSGNIRRLMAAMYANNNTAHGRAMRDFYSRSGNGTGYEQELESLKKEREDYQRMYDEEDHKKKSSGEALEEYRKKMAELDIQILSFSEDLANELWGIDIQGWADQISDALMTAFENGESAAQAYADTVKSIMQGVVNKMLAIGVIEPMMKKLQDNLFGYVDENGNRTEGLFDVSNPRASMGRVMEYMGRFFGAGGEGANTITAAGEFLNGMEKLMNSHGLSLRSDQASTLSSGVAGVTEETSSLLAGYVNALRQDVSYNRLALEQFFMQMWPSYVETFTASVTHSANIDNNTRMMMEMMRDGSGALFDEISRIRNRFDNVTNGVDSISIR